ncbi:MAG: anti-sigma factor [Gammaproteobacteria bacterium]
MAEPGPQGQLDEAMMDLLVKQVAEGLSPAEQRALDVLDSAVASANLRELERAAAAVSLAGSSAAPPLPAGLAQRIERQAQEHFLAVAHVPVAPGGAPRPAHRAVPRSGIYGWFAAAACLVLALFAWNRSPLPAGKPSTPTAERAALLAKSDSLKIAFGATKDPAAAGVSGDVVWDPATQRGFLHFVGLAANDPALRQYQLWIFDGGRDQRYPVDGGVFDIPANATEVVIPIHAALPVLSAKAFAVTVEKPGGVVVSGREHVVVLGAAS